MIADVEESKDYSRIKVSQSINEYEIFLAAHEGGNHYDEAMEDYIGLVRNQALLKNDIKILADAEAKFPNTIVADSLVKLHERLAYTMCVMSPTSANYDYYLKHFSLGWRSMMITNRADSGALKEIYKQQKLALQKIDDEKQYIANVNEIFRLQNELRIEENINDVGKILNDIKRQAKNYQMSMDELKKNPLRNLVKIETVYNDILTHKSVYPRGEYETTNKYQEKREKWLREKLPAEIHSTFLPKHYIKYFPDYKLWEIYIFGIDYSQIFKSDPLYKVSNSQENLFSVVVVDSTEWLGKYIAETAMGVKVEVTKSRDVNYILYAVGNSKLEKYLNPKWDDERPTETDSSPGLKIDYSGQVLITMEPSEAKNIEKDNIKVVYGFAFNESIYDDENIITKFDYREPTLSHAFDVVKYEYYIPVVPKFIWVYTEDGKINEFFPF